MDPQAKSSPRRIRLPEGFDYKKFEAAGVDIGLLLGSLNKTPTERAESNKSMISFAEEARKAREMKRYAPTRS